MVFWNRRKRKIQDGDDADSGQVQKSKKAVKRSPPEALEVKLLAIEALEYILAHRREHPDHGVRRIRDELRRNDGLAVSAEKVRTVVNNAGLCCHEGLKKLYFIETSPRRLTMTVTVSQLEVVNAIPLLVALVGCSTPCPPHHGTTGGGLRLGP